MTASITSFGECWLITARPLQAALKAVDVSLSAGCSEQRAERRISACWTKWPNWRWRIRFVLLLFEDMGIDSNYNECWIGGSRFDSRRVYE